MIRIFITATHENIDEVLTRLNFGSREDLETAFRSHTHTTVTTVDDDEQFTWRDLVRLGLTHGSEQPPSGTPPFHADIEDDDCSYPSHHGVVWTNEQKCTADLDRQDDPVVSCQLARKDGVAVLAYDPVEEARAFTYLLTVEDGGFRNALDGRESAEET